jgi:hypothetical protein
MSMVESFVNGIEVAARPFCLVSCRSWKYNGYTGNRAGPARGPTLGTKEVKRERWRPAKALAWPADRH